MAAEALDVFASGAIVDIVFSDVQMPGPMNGEQLADWMRENRPTVPILLTSGNRSIRALTAHPFIAKPYRLEEMARWLERLLHESKTAERAVHLVMPAARPEPNRA